MVALPLGASAADATAGDSVVLPLGKKGAGLRVKGVKLSAIKPAKLSGAKLTLPVADVTLPKVGQGQLVLKGGLSLKAGKKKTTIQGFLLTVKGSKISLTAKLGSSRLEVFTATAGAGTKLDAGATSVVVGAAKLKLSSKAAAKLKKALGRPVKTASLGAISGGSKAYFPPLVADPNGPTEKPWDEPLLPARPGTAVNVSSAPLVWWIRDSWVNYSVGNAAPQASEGAIPQAAVVDDIGGHKCPSDNPDASRTNVYAFGLPFSSGWHDSASATTVLTFSGYVRFYYAGRFDISFGNAEVVITPGGSTMNMSVKDSIFPAGRRAGMFNVQTSPTLAGGPFGLNGPASLLGMRISAAGAAGPFGGMYSTNLPWGCIDLTYGV
jgi:hypothetical protein